MPFWLGRLFAVFLLRFSGLCALAVFIAVLPQGRSIFVVICKRPPPPFARSFCCNCQSPPVVAISPVPLPCTAWHSVVRRCCPPPSVSPPCAPSPPFHQQFPPFPSPDHQLIMSSNLNGIAAASFAVGGEKAAQIPIGPTEAQQQIQPVIYVIETGGGGNRLMPLANESAGEEGITAQTTAEEGNGNEGERTTEMVVEEKEAKGNTKTTTEEVILGEEEQSNSTERTTKGNNLKRKVNLGTKPSKRIKVKTMTREKPKKVKNFDEREMESEAEAFYDYEETKSGRKEKVAEKIAQLFEIEKDFLERKRNARQKRISNSESVNECNSGLMARIMGSAIVEESAISKRLIKRSLKYSFPGSKFDVICAAGGVFSYAIYGRRYCEVKRKGVTCLAFE